MITAILPTNNVLPANITHVVGVPAGVPVRERSMLVDFTVTMWSAHKHDKKVSAEVADSHNASADSGRYNKRLVAKDALAEIRKVAGEALKDHYDLTLPWMNSGARILPSAAYLTYAARQRAHDEAFRGAVRKFVGVYPRVVADARISLNGLFNSNDYPDVSEIEGRFTIGYNILPMPDAQDFRLDLGAVETERIERQLEANLQQAFEEATRSTYRRIIEVVARVGERLRAYNPTDPQEHPFRDSLIGNVKELVELLPALNVTSDPGLAAIAGRVQDELCVYSPDTLRASQDARQRTAAAADSILELASEFMA